MAEPTYRDTFESETEFGKGVVHSWASIIEDKTRHQAEAISRVAIVEGHLALMPDAHFGFGPPVGSALVTRGGVMPYAVGVDIGCGMIAVQTDLHRMDLAGHEAKILGHIRELIPSGVGTSHQVPLPQAGVFFEAHGDPPGIGPASRLANKRGLLAAQHDSLRERARIQFGTLGSGNHFVEVCEDEEGKVWLLLHSGSRGIGNVLATAHVKEAKAFCQENDIQVEDDEFSYVVEGSRQYREYLDDMLWAQAYAYAQREAMMDGLMVAVQREVGERWSELARINCHHNYAEIQPDGSVLTRKGAIEATAGTMGVIPGSMGAATYIVRGRGNAEAYHSSPHGAGRLLGRKVAYQTLDLAAFKAEMASKTWLDQDAENLLDEAPAAYKPIAQVMGDSASLVDPVTVISQFINYKGL